MQLSGLDQLPRCQRPQVQLLAPQEKENLLNIKKIKKTGEKYDERSINQKFKVI